MNKPLRIAINAQIPTASGAGGIETVLRVLTQLNQFGDEEFVFIGHHSDSAWIGEMLGERQSLVCAPPPKFKPNRAEYFKNLSGSFRPLARKIKHLAFGKPQKILPSLPISDGFFESLNCDVVHFPYQDFVQCKLPSVYNPHDLQHLHFPHFFTAGEITRREIMYPKACHTANTVVVASQFVKDDIINNYGVTGEKIHVIPWSPPEIEHIGFSQTETEKVLQKYNCPPLPFALYPAMTWEHKNHLRLLEAIYLLRERDNLRVNLVCTGERNSFFGEIEKRLRKLNLENQIQFTGIVEYLELCALYRSAQFVIVPTLFEAASAPLFEAWQHGAPVTCSAVTSLPEQAGDAALLFNPYSVEAIADAIKTFAENENLREKYRQLGFQRLQDFNMESTANAYFEVYRKSAGLNQKILI